MLPLPSALPDRTTESLLDPDPDDGLVRHAMLAGEFLCEIQELLVYTDGDQPLAGLRCRVNERPQRVVGGSVGRPEPLSNH